MWCFAHGYNNKNIGGGLRFVEANSINYYLLMLLESVFICAVNVYMIISGFFSYRIKKTTLFKPFELIFQVIFFSFSWHVFVNAIRGSLSVSGILRSCVPVNYFVILYVTVYFLTPYLNSLYEKINLNFLVLIFSLFSVYPTLVDIFNQLSNQKWLGLSSIGVDGSQGGYQIVNFIMMYYFGVFIRKYTDQIEKISYRKILLALVVDMVLIFVWSCWSNYLGYDENIALEYCNPLVVLEAVLVFIMFLRIDIGCNKRINKLSVASFTVFLFHGNLINHIKIEWAVKQKVVVLFLHILISVVVIYLICFGIYVVYDFVTKHFLEKLIKKDRVITKI